MATCVYAASTTTWILSSPATSPCSTPDQQILISQTEYEQLHLLTMTPAEALQIATPILACWAIAWGFRQVAEFIKSRHMTQTQE